MGLGVTRKILAVIFSVVIAVSVVVLIASLAVRYTLADQGFLKKTLISAEVVAQCDAQLTAKYETLSAETNIPARVFETVKDDYPIERSAKTAIDNIFGAEDTALYNSNMVNYFYNLCTEYLDGSDIAYEEEDITNTAEQAAMIFSDTVGLHHVDAVREKVNGLSVKATRLMTLSVFVIVFAVILIFVLYTDKVRGLYYVFGGFSGGAIGTLLAAALCLLTKVAARVTVMPAVYQSAMNRSAVYCFAVMMLASAVTLFLSSASSVITDKKSHQRK